MLKAGRAKFFSSAMRKTSFVVTRGIFFVRLLSLSKSSLHYSRFSVDAFPFFPVGS
jgi:hypothetical protein